MTNNLRQKRLSATLHDGRNKKNRGCATHPRLFIEVISLLAYFIEEMSNFANSRSVAAC